VRAKVALRVGGVVVVGAGLVGPAACGDPEPARAATVDGDGDGLSDVDEREVYGTSPVLADTDGDGVSDREEIVAHAFDPEGAPTRWNPRVADVPTLVVTLLSKPLIVLAVTDTTGTVRTFQTGDSVTDTVTDRAATTTTDSHSDTSGSTWGETHQLARTATDSVTLGSSSAVATRFPATSGAADAGAGAADAGAADAGAADAGAAGAGDAGAGDAGAGDAGAGEAHGDDDERGDDARADGGAVADGGAPAARDAGAATSTPERTFTDTATGSVTSTDASTITDGVNATWSDSGTDSVSLAYTTEEAVANARTLSEALSLATADTQTTISGSVKIAVVLTGSGHLPFQVGYILLAATLRSGDTVSPIGNLYVDAPAYTTYPPFSLGPGDSTPPMTFTRDLSVTTARKLLSDSSSLDVRLAVLELRDRDGRPFVFQADDVLGKTAEIDLDFGPERAPERWRVATNLDPSRRGVTLARALGEVLRVPYEVEGGRLARVRGVGEKAGARFTVERRHTGPDGVATKERLDPVDPAAVVLVAGDALRIAYAAP
jgi:hypothetical protein